MCVYLSTKFQVSSIILTSFKHGCNPPPPLPSAKRTIKKPIQIKVNIESSRLIMGLNKEWLVLLKG